MNKETDIFSIDDNLINCIQDCLSNVSSLTTIAKNLSIIEIKKLIKKENLEVNNNKQQIIKKNVFEIIVNSVLGVLGTSKFKIEKTFSPQKCPSCNGNQLNPFEINYVKINLDNYFGTEFDLDEFIKPIKGEAKCRKCKKKIKSEFNFTLLPEILMIILGAKPGNKYFRYKYNHTFKYLNKNNNNNPTECNYILKGLIGQMSLLKYKSFLFNNEAMFKNEYERNNDIFSNPTILFYEGPKKKYNEDNEYLEPDEIYLEENINNDNTITVYFNFEKYEKKVYVNIGINEKFSKAISELKEKYMWLRHLKNLKFYLNKKLLDENKTLAENGIQADSFIDIV